MLRRGKKGGIGSPLRPLHGLASPRPRP